MSYIAAYLLASVFIGCVLGLILKLSSMRSLEQAQKELDEMVRGEARFPAPRKNKELV